MNETLILILGATPEHPVRWGFVADGQVRLASIAENVDSLSSIKERARGARQVVAVLRGEDAALRIMPAPPRSNAQFRAAAGFLLEDELAENIAGLHFSATRNSGGAGRVIAIKKSVLESWRFELLDEGLSPDVLSVDFALLPIASGRAVVIDAPDRMIVALGEQGFAMEKPMAEDVLSTLLIDETINDIIFYGDREIQVDGREGLILDRRGPVTDETMFRLFAKALEEKTAPNFLQGQYRKKRDWKIATGPWRRAAVLAAACIAAFVFSIVVGNVRSLRLADRLEEETLDLHRAAFPDAPEADPRTHARTVLASGGGAAVFLPVTTLIAEALSDVEGVQLDRLRYNAERSEYSVNLRFADIAKLDAFKRALEARGVTAAEAGGVRRSGGFYLGEMRVSLS